MKWNKMILPIHIWLYSMSILYLYLIIFYICIVSYSISILCHITIWYNPLHTIVVECNNAETGVGAIIADVNHGNPINIAD